MSMGTPSSSICHRQTRQRWNPEYPPGNPGKPHPVGCALNGEAKFGENTKIWSGKQATKRHDESEKETLTSHAERVVFI